ncbi:hypothetical protein A2U01_0066173, partial [Trifolium medium]|nr:hypothetical protein [Trifolium medium]
IRVLQPPPPDHQQHHQDPPHIPQHHQYSDYEMGMVVHQYNTSWRMDLDPLPFTPALMAAVQEYRARTPTPSYYQLYHEVADLEAHFQRQTTRLVEHQTHIR